MADYDEHEADGPEGRSYPKLRELKALSETLGQAGWSASSDTAQVVANYLCCHPAVAEVRYAGLREDPLFAEASCTLERGFGPLVGFRPVSGGWRLLDCSGARDARAFVLSLEAELAR